MTDPARRADLAKIHIAKKDLGLSDDAYEAAVRQASCGKKTSSGDLTKDERAKLLDQFSAAGFKPKKGTGKRVQARDARQAKIKALWAALWNLGVIAADHDAALAAFIERQTGVKALHWLNVKDSNKVIEGLKAMAARDAGVKWNEHENPRVCVAHAQWRRLGGLGVLRIPSKFALNGWLTWKVSDCETTVEQLDNAQLDKAANRLGKWLRQELEP